MTSFSIFRQHWKNLSWVLNTFENFMEKSKCSIFHNILKYMIFQRRKNALLWGKELIDTHLLCSSWHPMHVNGSINHIPEFGNKIWSIWNRWWKSNKSCSNMIIKQWKMQQSLINKSQISFTIEFSCLLSCLHTFLGSLYWFIMLAYMVFFLSSTEIHGEQWLSGRVLDLRLNGRGFESHRRHCFVSFSKTRES